ncbi:PIGS transamidase, partial [Centropus unirufus]|nr:PIGS transamidase [Centropus unirufus]
LAARTSITSRYEMFHRGTTAQEEAALAVPTAQEADAALQPLQDALLGSLTVYVVPETSSLLPQGISVYVGKHRSALVRAGGSQATLRTRLRQLTQVMSFTASSIAAALSDRVPDGQPGPDAGRHLKSSLGMDLHPGPVPCPGEGLVVLGETLFLLYLWHPWASFGAADLGVFPLPLGVALDQDLCCDSCVLGHNPPSGRAGKEGGQILLLLGTPSLPLAQPRRWPCLTGCSSAASLYPVLNFLLYIPERSHSPLYIQDKDGAPVSTNAFHSPRWGGIMIYNVEAPASPQTSLPLRVNVDMVRVMEVFLAQLRLLFGLSRDELPPEFLLESPGNEGLADWEVDRLLWAHAVENIATVSTTLTSLAQLLDKIGNIVIKDDVASEVYRAVAAAQSAVAELATGHLHSAFQASKEAVTSSERAFFDPSLLHLLYFPDDQKFAIYIPLFLPMAVPILLSLAKIIREARQRKKEPTKMD